MILAERLHGHAVHRETIAPDRFKPKPLFERNRNGIVSPSRIAGYGGVVPLAIAVSNGNLAATAVSTIISVIFTEALHRRAKNLSD